MISEDVEISAPIGKISIVFTAAGYACPTFFILDFQRKVTVALKFVYQNTFLSILK